MKLLELVDLSKKYKNPVLSKVSFEVEEAEKVAILGRNGAGKSTLLKILATLEKKDKGVILYKGKNILEYTQDYRRQIGYVPQEILLFEELNGIQNLDFWFNAYNIDKKQRKEILSYIIEECELREKIHERVACYSGGMKRRLNIAVSLLHNPRILILDEPDVGMDIVVAEKIYNIIERINKKNKTACLIATHNFGKAEQFCEKFIVLEKGKILAQIHKKEIYKMQKNLEEWYLDIIKFAE